MPNASPFFWVGLASAFAMIIGAFGPWARVLGLISVSGTDGGDGWILIAAALIGSVALWLGRMGSGRLRLLLALAILAAAAGAATAGHDLGALKHIANDAGPPRVIFVGDIVSAGWGIYVDLVASIVFGLATIVLWVQLQRGATAAGTPTSGEDRDSVRASG